MNTSNKWRKYVIVGWSAVILSIAIVAISQFYLNVKLDSFIPRPWGGLVYGFLIALPVSASMFLCVRILKYARRLRAKEVTDQQNKDYRDDKAPVLYLRSFKDDKAMGAVIGLRTTEEQLAYAVQDIGPLIAVGLPGEPLPQTGAARIYIPHDKWQADVAKLIAKAHLIVFHIGNTKTEGLWWELQQAFSKVAPHRIVIYIRCSPTRLDVQLQNIADLIGHSEVSFNITRRLVFMIHGFLRFDKDWHAEFTPLQRRWRYILPLSANFIRFRATRPLEFLMRQALQPTYYALGVKLRQPPAIFGAIVRLISIVIFIPLVVFGWAILYHSYFRDEAILYRNLDNTTIAYTKSVLEMSEADFLTSMPKKEKQARIDKMAEAGFVRLSDDDLLLRATLVRRMLNNASTTECAGLAQGRLEMVRATKILSREDFNAWMYLKMKALRSELKGLTPKVVSAGDVEALAIKIINIDPEAYTRRFRP